jgi:tRNA-splicing ligase RtcB (3'-phosphate/5'-hydroxy nucleic acid ligase)
MKSHDVQKMGYPAGPILHLALSAAGEARVSGQRKSKVLQTLRALILDAHSYKDDPLFGKVANALIAAGIAPKPRVAAEDYHFNESLQYNVWGKDIDEQAHQQMRNACKLPISVAGALMPDAHVGYGLPIGGVLATDNAVIPYAVGVDIACRMMMTVFDLPPHLLREDEDRFKVILENNTRFGVGAEWKPKRDHPVMDENWNTTPVTARLKEKAHRQLGTSGSGNHFVEFGEITFLEPVRGIPAGKYLAVLSHSGSRGAGNDIAMHYSKWAMSRHAAMPRELKHLAWLELDGPGEEYWAAMELMGKYASANHHIIHRQIVKAMGEQPLLQLENHHNFAWREQHGGRQVIVHRKGATPAGRGVLGIIPGSMAAPAYVVEGLGNEASLQSAAHGAGRQMSRGEAMRTFKWSQVKLFLKERGVTLLSAGLDEAPWVYKDIDKVMAAQESLVRPVARFMPRLVKMSPPGDRPED